MSFFYIPNLNPEGFKALLSPGTVFLLHAIEISSKILSALAPDIPVPLKSTRSICTSVPPVAILYPFSCNPAANRRAFATTCF